MVVVRAILLVAIATVSAACVRDAPVNVDLPRTPIVRIRAGYALVLPDYVRVFSEPGASDEIAFHLRQGDIVEVVTKSDRRDWTNIRAEGRTGWVEARHIRPFESREQATNARRTYLERLP